MDLPQVCIYDLQTGLLEQTVGALKQHDSSCKSLQGNLRFVNEEHIEDNEVNIGVMDPLCNHLASRCWHKVFGVFLFTICFGWNSKNNGFHHFCCFGKGWTTDAAPDYSFFHTNFPRVSAQGWYLSTLFRDCPRQKNNLLRIVYKCWKQHVFPNDLLQSCKKWLSSISSKDKNRATVTSTLQTVCLVFDQKSVMLFFNHEGNLYQTLNLQ